MMRARKGQVVINKHLKRPSNYIKPFTVMAVAAGVTGCSDTDNSVYFFDDVASCKSNKQFSAMECISAYQIAEKKAQRASFEYRTEKECFDNFGFGVCQKNKGHTYQPNNFGWIMTHAKVSNTNANNHRMLVEPVYLSTNPRSARFGKLILVDKYGTPFYVGKHDSKKVNLPKSAFFNEEQLERHSSGSYFTDDAGVIVEKEWDDHDNYYSYNSLYSTSGPSKVVHYSAPPVSELNSKTKQSTSNMKHMSFSSSKSVKGFGSTSRSKSSWSWGG